MDETQKFFWSEKVVRKRMIGMIEGKAKKGTVKLKKRRRVEEEEKLQRFLSHCDKNQTVKEREGKERVHTKLGGDSVILHFLGSFHKLYEVQGLTFLFFVSFSCY